MRRGFTLVELLTVAAIIALVMGMALSVPRQDRRRAAVEAAARELAATLRQARSLALERRSSYAVVFNLANGAGTSGRVLNNWGGGHWYQILGAGESPNVRSAMAWTHPLPQLHDPAVALPSVLAAVGGAWYGERHVLAPRQVRFLALSDQDNGMVRLWYRTDAINMRAFPETYPRPWCGWWEASTGLLHAWGGYDDRRSGGQPVTRSTDGRNCSAFHYEGSGGAVAGSLNPADRASSIDGRLLLQAGTVRPVVNADWLDSYVSFRPDGSAAFGDFGELRAWSYGLRGTAYGGAATARGDIGDFTPRFDWSFAAGVIDADTQQAGHFQRRTGFWYITLAPDAETDGNSFPSAQAAQRSLMPAYRIGISPAGEVRIVPVRSFLPSGAELDDWIAPSQWSNWTVTTGTTARYQRGLMTNADGSSRGLPVVDALTPEMLAQRAWWLKP